MKIALLEDDKKIATHLNAIMSAQGWSVQHFEKISDLILSLKIQTDFDIIVMDRLLSDGDSAQELQNIKKKAPEARILILSSIDFPKEKAKWLSEGADEYMGKPVFSDELVARIKILKGRSNTSATPMQIQLKDLTVNLLDRTVFSAKQKLDLSAKEFNLLLLLIGKPGRIFNKLQILEHVWGYDSTLETNVVESTLNHLRRKLESAGSDVNISNKRNLGYWIEE